jgi:hypothetical protein
VTASIVMQFLDQQEQQRFWGALSTTGPASDVAGFPIVFTCFSRSSVNANVPYKTELHLPNCKITSAPTPGRTGGVLQQTLTIAAYQSAPQANDDLQIVVTNAASAVT